jgi:hypothetical protein
MNINIRSLIAGAVVTVTLMAVLGFKALQSPAAYTWRQFSTIESVVPGGLGRSRIIISDANDQEIGKDLLNFYSMVGINFKNIANNDRLIVDNINQWQSEGWELYTVTAGVQSPGAEGGNGIFITRYLFRKPA